MKPHIRKTKVGNWYCSNGEHYGYGDTVQEAWDEMLEDMPWTWRHAYGRPSCFIGRIVRFFLRRRGYAI